MGLRKRAYYTIECNHCGKLLEDDVGEMAGVTKKEIAINTAIDCGWNQIGNNTWLCTDCKEDYDNLD